MSKITLAGAMGLLLLGASGCQIEIDEWDYDGYGGYGDDVGYDVGRSASTLQLDDGFLQGSMGAYEDFSADAYQFEAYDYGDMTEITMHAGSGYWVMTSMVIHGGLSGLEPGTSLDISDSDYAGAESYVSTIGCSGPSHGNFDYDAGAERVQVQVSQGASPNERVLDFTATFAEYSYGQQTVTGSMSYVVQ